jgi:hypothetical protein
VRRASEQARKHDCSSQQMNSRTHSDAAGEGARPRSVAHYTAAAVKKEIIITTTTMLGKRGQHRRQSSDASITSAAIDASESSSYWNSNHSSSNNKPIVGSMSRSYPLPIHIIEVIHNHNSADMKQQHHDCEITSPSKADRRFLPRWYCKIKSSKKSWRLVPSGPY